MNTKAITATQLATMELERRQERALISPLLARGEVILIYAPTGVGKTWFTHSLAYSAASGCEFLHHKTERPRKVIYIDGEMGLKALQERQEAIDTGFGGKLKAGHKLDYITSDMFGGVLPTLADPANHKDYSELVSPYDIVVIDNLMTVAPPGIKHRNDLDAWLPVQNWVIARKAEGKGVVLVHHTNKNQAQQTGTQQRENIMDAIIRLRRATLEKPQMSEGLIALEYTKLRHIAETDLPNLHLSRTITTNADGQHTLAWKYEQLENVERRTVGRLKDKGLKQNMIEAITGLPKWKVSEYLQGASITDSMQSNDKEWEYERDSDGWPF